MLLVYDDAVVGSKQPGVELKLMNFGSSYALPEGVADAAHDTSWDGSAESHEDGYLMGVRNLLRLMKELHAELGAERSPTRGGGRVIQMPRTGSSGRA